jgi:mannobiose 2-epimerase
MPEKKIIQETLTMLEAYLRARLLPFWIENCPDPAYGGVLTYFNRHGKPTGETEKTFLMQIRTLYTMSSVHRYGYGDGRAALLAGDVARFIRDHFWDAEQGGWYWIADRAGKITVDDKVGYGQCFGIYAFSEYYLATGDPLGKETALATYNAVCANMLDTRSGGFFELMERGWQLKPGGVFGGDRKSLDVHMHMMEALTSLYQMTGSPVHRRRLLEVIDLITSRMLHPENGLGYIHFTYDYQPLRRIIFATEWGRDARPAEEAAPIDQTSPGHNVEFAWLLLHAADVLGIPRQNFARVTRPLFDHCIEFGIDPTYGGVYADVPMHRPANLTDKQFWQQAEVLIGMLDAYLLFGDEKYWDAFMNVLTFVFEKMVVMEAGGEWYERVDRVGNPVDDALGHAWKINYHTVRSMVQSIRRLQLLVEQRAA